MIEKRILSETYRLCPDGGKLLVCVSGGIDSVVLLDILHCGGWDISVAHCNFSLRGEESDGDEAFVKEICKKYGIVCHVTRFDTDGYAKENGLNTQLAARELRYNYFETLRKEYGYSHIVIAHHLDDDIETFFINLLRGTGVKGLSGISDSRGYIIRPMLSITREEIAKYAESKGLSHREDRTNKEDHYLRNRIRHQIIPSLVGLSPSFRKTMFENIKRVSETRDFIEERMQSEKKNVETEPGVYSTSYLENCQHRSLILFELLHPMGFNTDVITQLEKALMEKAWGKWFIGESYRALLGKNSIRVIPNNSCGKTDQQKEIIYSIKAIPIAEAGDYLHAPKETAYLDADKLRFPLTSRKWEPGDRIHPLGMRGSKTVGDFLADRNIPLDKRETIKVIVDASGEIAWIVGMQISEKFKIDSNTEKVVIL